MVARPDPGLLGPTSVLLSSGASPYLRSPAHASAGDLTVPYPGHNVLACTHPTSPVARGLKPQRRHRSFSPSFFFPKQEAGGRASHKREGKCAAPPTGGGQEPRTIFPNILNLRSSLIFHLLSHTQTCSVLLCREMLFHLLPGLWSKRFGPTTRATPKTGLGRWPPITNLLLIELPLALLYTTLYTLL